MIIYADTSAAFKLIVEEVESPKIAEYLDTLLDRGDEVISSWLLHTEMHCAADRRRAIHPEAVNEVLEFLELVDIERADLQRAASSSWGLRSADAVHLATALRLEVDAFLTYDAELREAAARAGLIVHTPKTGTP